MPRLSLAAAATVLLAASPCPAEEAGPFGLPCFVLCGPAEGGAPLRHPSAAEPGHHRARRSARRARYRDDAETADPRRRRMAWSGGRPDRDPPPRRRLAPVAVRAPAPPEVAVKARPVPPAAEPATLDPLPDVPVAPLD